MLTFESHELIRWYDDHVRPFLAANVDEDKLRAFDKDHAQLKSVADLSQAELAVCFLGNSGVGKSTLINAVIGGDQIVVPSGGVGPLTAQALVVRHNSEVCFEVDYHGKGQLLRTVFGLEQMYRAELGTKASPEDDLEQSEDLEEQDLAQSELDLDAGDQAEGADEQARREKREGLRRRAQLLVTGNQDEERDLKYLLDSLREAAGGKRLWDTTADARDGDRISAIGQALSLAAKKLRHKETAKADAGFSKALHNHATGFLAPLIKSLELGWDTPTLSHGITLVDLPGVGVMRDVHREVTRYWIREKANALVLIVDHRGLHDSVAAALRESEFLNSLLYSADEPEDDPVVLVAVTRIDDIANTRYQQDKSKKKFQHFLDAMSEAQDKLRHDMQRSLESVWLGGSDIPPGRRKVVENVLSRLQVHPLSAPEYVRLMADDPDDRSFLLSVDQSGVPAFTNSLIQMAAERRVKAQNKLEQNASLFLERITTTLSLIQGQWQTDARTEEQVRKLKDDLDLFIQPLRKELHVRQGAYRTFLKKTIPQRIEDLVETASLKAAAQINHYLRSLGSAHWATLRASVKRGGRYVGSSDINLPSQFALRFEEPIADVWGKDILTSIRRETRDYSNDCVQLVEQLAEWALSQGALVDRKVVEAQRDAIKVDAKKLESVGREMVKEMRDEARAQLINRIEGPIKRRCDDFVKKNLHIGPGVKVRILEAYGEMAAKVTESAREPATRILQELFKDVEKEILDAFSEHEDPLAAVAESIVASRESYLKRSDAQKRRRVLEQVNQVLAKTPGQSATLAVSE